MGSATSIPVDVRIIAATSRDLRKMLREGTFREDLYHRPNVFTIFRPIAGTVAGSAVAGAVLHQQGHTPFATAASLRSGIDPESAERLPRYDWPGNVREWENLAERAVILDYDSKLKLDRYRQPNVEPGASGASLSEEGLDGRRVRELVRQYCEELMKCREVPQKEGAGPAAVARTYEGDGRFSPCLLGEVVRGHIEAALRYAGDRIHGPGGGTARREPGRPA